MITERLEFVLLAESAREQLAVKRRTNMLLAFEIVGKAHRKPWIVGKLIGEMWVRESIKVQQCTPQQLQLVSAGANEKSIFQTRKQINYTIIINSRWAVISRCSNISKQHLLVSYSSALTSMRLNRCATSSLQQFIRLLQTAWFCLPSLPPLSCLSQQPP